MYVDAAAGAILSSAQAITVTAVSTGVYDTAGLGVGQAVTNRFGTATSFGEDVGGGGPLVSGPQLVVTVPTAFTAGGAATLRVQLQAAVDVNNTGLPVTWDTIVQTDDIAVALLGVSSPQRPLVSFTVPDRYQGQNFPRFYRLNYIVATGPMLTGAVNAMLLTGIDDVPFYPPNY
jgi:hypothetical protein